MRPISAARPRIDLCTKNPPPPGILMQQDDLLDQGKLIFGSEMEDQILIRVCKASEFFNNRFLHVTCFA